VHGFSWLASRVWPHRLRAVDRLSELSVFRAFDFLFDLASLRHFRGMFQATAMPVAVISAIRPITRAIVDHASMGGISSIAVWLAMIVDHHQIG
jgi:hypothetical protein